MTDQQNETPKGWAVVPGTSEKAPIIEIVVLVAALGFVFAGLVTAICGFLVGLMAVL